MPRRTRHPNWSTRAQHVSPANVRSLQPTAPLKKFSPHTPYLLNLICSRLIARFAQVLARRAAAARAARSEMGGRPRLY
jgi:hypothetical protein